MSHSVTITRTTTSTTNTSYIVLNTGYLKTFPGLLKLFELLIGAATVGLIAYWYHRQSIFYGIYPDLFLFLMATTFMIGTFCLLLSCLTSLSTGGLVSKTIYLIGGAVVGLLAYHYQRGSIFFGNAHPDLFLYLMATAFMICTFCLLLSCLTSLSTGGLISKTIFELIYHSVACLLLLAAGLNMVIELKDYPKNHNQYDIYLAAGILALVNAVLYFLSAFFAHRSYRGI